MKAEKEETAVESPSPLEPAPKEIKEIDPFGRTDTAYLWSPLELAKVSVLFILLGIPRLILVFFLLSVYALYVRVAAIIHRCTVDEVQKYPVPRRAFVRARVFARAVLFVIGFRVRIEGDSDIGTARVVVGNHVSMADILCLWGYCPGDVVPSFVSKAGMRSVPILGTLLGASRCILVRRSTPGSGTSNLVADRARTSAADEPPIAMFPEGTTTNGSALIRFHTGAFVAGAPVKPVALEYPHVRFNPAYDVMLWPEYVLRCFGQLYGDIVIRYLPVHVPTEAEKADPALFAKNVRDEIAAVLKQPVVDKSYSDKLVYMNIPVSSSKFD